MLTEEERKARNRERTRSWILAHPEKHKANMRRWRLANPEKNKANKKAWAKTHAEQEKARKAAWRLAHPNKMEACRQAWRLAHPDQRRAKNKAWRLAHVEQMKAQHHAWRLANPGAGQVICQRYRAQKRNLPNTLTVSEWRNICAAYRFRCAYCGKKTKLTQDHVLSLSKGGGTTAHNTLPACQSCNASKQTGPPPKPVNLALGI